MEEIDVRKGELVLDLLALVIDKLSRVLEAAHLGPDLLQRGNLRVEVPQQWLVETQLLSGRFLLLASKISIFEVLLHGGHPRHK